jgi:voltage-gated potassium channel
MVALAVLVVVLLPFEDEGWVLAANLAVWAIFVLDYGTRPALSTDRRSFFKRNVIDLLAIMPADFFRALCVLRVVGLLRIVRAATVVGGVLREVRGVAYTNGLNWSSSSPHARSPPAPSWYGSSNQPSTRCRMRRGGRW